MEETVEGKPRGRWSAVDQLAELVPPADRELIHQGPTWVHVTPRGATKLPAQGWKLHISARAASIPRVAAKVLPYLWDAQIPFKVVRDQSTLTALNEGSRSPAAVGKAITVYPSPDSFVRVATTLADLLVGETGPRVLSDRQVRADAPVYYRYGPFRPHWRIGPSGVPEIAMVGPDGQVVDGLAGLEYSQPEWVTDPFGRPADELRGTVLGGRYEVTEGLQQSARGDVYRAIDQQTGERVIVKQARAFVSEASDAPVDTRARLRNERRILKALTGHEGVPRFIDHFSHGPDEYLVVSELPGKTLLDAVLLDGRFRTALGESAPDEVWQDFQRLASRLVTTLRRIHKAGVILRDISPRNIMVTADSAGFIDFGISSYDNFWLPGGTPGFCPEHQLHDARRPTPDDDIHALARSLLFAITGVMPVVGCVDEEWSHLAYLRQVACTGCVTPTQFVTLLEELRHRWPLPPPPPPVDLDRVRERLLSRLIDEIEAQLDSPDIDYFRVDSSVYTGMAGIGRELLWECGRDEAIARLVTRLAERCVHIVESMGVLPGLMIGATGVEVFLTEARHRGIDVPSVSWPRVSAVTASSDRGARAGVSDYNVGETGVAVGYLELARLGSSHHRDAAFDLITQVLADPSHRSPTVTEDLPLDAGVDKRWGAAHGLSGLIECLACAVLMGGDQFREPLEALVAECQTRMTAIHDYSRSRTGLPISASWCQGLAGVARALVGAGVALGSDTTIQYGHTLLATALKWIPRLANVTACCGMIGVASVALDVAEMLGSPTDAKDDVARVLETMSLRSFQRDDLDLFDLREGEAPLSLCLGLTGVLHLLRRIADGGSGFLPSPLVPLAAHATSPSTAG